MIVTRVTVTEDGKKCTDLRDSLGDGLDMMCGRERDGLMVTLLFWLCKEIDGGAICWEKDRSF